MFVAEAPDACAPLVQVLLEEGFQVLQRPFSAQVKELLPPSSMAETPRLLVLQPPVPADVRLVQALRRRHPLLPLLLLLEAGDEVTLTPREFRLLECFMRQPGRALTREQLIEQVWGPDYSGDSKSVDVHVLWLRRKLDRSAPTPQLFITVRGIGYRLDPPRG